MVTPIQWKISLWVFGPFSNISSWNGSAPRGVKMKSERQTDKLRHSFSKKDPDSIISINLRHFSNPPSGGVRMPRAKVINSLSSRYWKQYQSILLLVVDESRGRKGRGRWRNTWKWNDCFRSQKHSISLSVRRPVLTILPIKTNVKARRRSWKGCQSNFVYCFIVIAILAHEGNCPSLHFEI